MRQDRTHWQCDRCKAKITVDLNEKPYTWWLALHVERVRYRFSENPADFDLCEVCSTTLQKWMRNDPPATRPDEYEPHIPAGHVAEDPEPGGGYFTVYVDRDLDRYPEPGARVWTGS